jgi:hypothetical protein
MNELRIRALRNICLQSCIMVDYILYVTMELFRRIKAKKSHRYRTIENNRDKILLFMHRLSRNFEPLDEEHAENNYYGYADRIQLHIYHMILIGVTTSNTVSFGNNLEIYFVELGWALRAVDATDPSDTSTREAALERLEDVIGDFDHLLHKKVLK